PLPAAGGRRAASRGRLRGAPGHGRRCAAGARRRAHRDGARALQRPERVHAAAAGRTMSARRALPLRALWMLPAAIALLAGLDAALLLLGLPAPVTTERLPQVHGVVLVLGFVGTLIALERATAWGRRIGFAAPALLGAGAVLLVIDAVPLTAA